MAIEFQVTFDAASPRALGEFWAEALGYIPAPPPAEFADWEAAFAAWGLPEEDWDKAYAIVDPDGAGPRIFFQRVPEGKTAKNRVHLDLRLAQAEGVPLNDQEAVLALYRRRAAELVERGATVVREFADPREGTWIVMRDPEGNEFCLD